MLTNALNKKKIGKKYANRWRIEYCFKHLKTNGFDLEDMSWRKLGKIRLCLSLVITAYILALREGYLAEEKAKKRQIKTEKKYKDGKVYPIVSLFRTGLTILIFKVANLTKISEYLNQIKTSKKKFYQIV